MQILPGDWTTHVGFALSGALTLSVVAHAVNTFPTPTNKYGAWALGVVQYAVGQRVTASNTLKGLQTATEGITTAEKEKRVNGTGNGGSSGG